MVEVGIHVVDALRAACRGALRRGAQSVDARLLLWAAAREYGPGSRPVSQALSSAITLGAAMRVQTPAQPVLLLAAPGSPANGDGLAAADRWALRAARWVVLRNTHAAGRWTFRAPPIRGGRRRWPPLWRLARDAAVADDAADISLAHLLYGLLAGGHSDVTAYLNQAEAKLEGLVEATRQTARTAQPDPFTPALTLLDTYHCLHGAPPRGSLITWLARRTPTWAGPLISVLRTQAQWTAAMLGRDRVTTAALTLAVAAIDHQLTRAATTLAPRYAHDSRGGAALTAAGFDYLAAMERAEHVNVDEPGEVRTGVVHEEPGPSEPWSTTAADVLRQATAQVTAEKTECGTTHVIRHLLAAPTPDADALLEPHRAALTCTLS